MSDNTVTSYTPAEFSLTESAVEHFASNLDGHLYKGIRLSVSESTGCSGYTYQIDYVEKISEDDLVSILTKSQFLSTQIHLSS